MSAQTTHNVEVPGGAVPTVVLGPEDASDRPALLAIPAIFGQAPDLLRRLASFSDRALITVPDPFWRDGSGVISYDEVERAFGRLKDIDLERSVTEMGAVLDWTRARCNGRVVGLGICFGGPFVLRFAREGRLDGVVTWHGSRMEDHLDGAATTRCPLRLHFGGADPITPPEVIEKIRAAFADHPDCSIEIHPGAVHGYSHDGDPYDENACQAGLDAIAALLGSLAS